MLVNSVPDELRIRALLASIAGDSAIAIASDLSCVYVVAPLSGKPCKVGKADSPIDRLIGIQTGNPYELFIHHTFWVTADIAHAVERRSHAVAAVRHGRMMGEWFSCSADEAAVAVEDACEAMEAIFYSRPPAK